MHQAGESWDPFMSVRDKEWLNGFRNKTQACDAVLIRYIILQRERHGEASLVEKPGL